jgi:Common central domain of tyrosinase
MAPTRRNFAHLTPAEREAFANAVRQIDLLAYPDGVSYWDKQDQIHQGTHNHGGNSFIPWHRELCNRFEKLLQQHDPDVALHYWDWTQDPRAADDGAGGAVSLCEDSTMGTANGIVGGVLAPLHNGDVLEGSRDDTGNPADPPRVIRRDCLPGAPGVPSDATILSSGAADPQAEQWTAFRSAAESAHDTAHTFFGFPTGTISQIHSAFEDPFVFLLHSNLDRLFAEWQTAPGEEWRLDPDQVYGDQSETADDKGILHNLQPWDGTVEFGAAIEPWVAPSSEIEVKNCRHSTVVRPPCYDTLPLTVVQAAPTPGDSIRFLDVYEGLETARALRLTIRGCRPVVCNATVAGDPRFTILDATVDGQDLGYYGTQDVFVWVMFDPGAAGTDASGTLTVNVPASGDTFDVPIEGNVISKPTVATSLVLDRSGSMASPSGVSGLSRIEVLRNSAPLFVNLLDDNDGIGVVRFDTDALEAEPVQVAGGMIGGAGRAGAITTISTHTTNPAGMTAIGDGVVAAETQLDLVAASFDERATVVFTDGHETEPQFIADVADSITDRIFAVGLGTADQLNPGALIDLANGTGGFVLLTGNPTNDDQILLQKYFAQILAGVTNADVVVDPDGFVTPNGTTVPYTLSEADRRTDVIVLSPAADAIRVELQAPDGTMFSGASGATDVATIEHRVVRLTIPPKSSGTWRALLAIETAGLGRYLERLKKNKDEAGIKRVRRYGVPFSLTVQSRSSVRMTVDITQASRRPGTSATVRATLTQAGIPLGFRASAWGEVTAPNGQRTRIALAPEGEGRYVGSVATWSAGVYRLLVRAAGTTFGGTRFTREALRTIAVWSRGDDTDYPRSPTGKPTKGHPDVCGLLRCLLRDRSVAKVLTDQGLDPASMLKCLEVNCR